MRAKSSLTTCITSKTAPSCSTWSSWCRPCGSSCSVKARAECVRWRVRHGVLAIDIGADRGCASVGLPRMTPDFPALAILHGGCALMYAVLSTLIIIARPLSRTGTWLALACLMTAFWAAAVVVYPNTATSGPPGWLELARAAAWYGFILHLYRRSVVTRGLLMQAFSTMGLLGLLLAG